MCIRDRYNIPEEKKRSEGFRYGPEQLFGPMIAVLLGLSFLLPDEKLAPVFIVSILTFGSWKYGLIYWFWINPLATYWALINLAELIDITDNYYTGYIFFIAGLIIMIQYYLRIKITQKPFLAKVHHYICKMMLRTQKLNLMNLFLAEKKTLGQKLFII